MGGGPGGYVQSMRGGLATGLRASLAVSTSILALGGCSVPSEPSPEDWRSAARQSLEDSASEVETVALVLRLDADGQLLAASARVAATESEESLATAVDSISTQQPPGSLQQQDGDLSDLLGRATDLVRAARVAITAGDEAAYADLRSRLLELSDDLDAEREELR